MGKSRFGWKIHVAKETSSHAFSRFSRWIRAFGSRRVKTRKKGPCRKQATTQCHTRCSPCGDLIQCVVERVVAQFLAGGVLHVQRANHDDVAGLAAFDVEAHAPLVGRHSGFGHSRDRPGNFFVAIFLRRVVMAVVGIGVLQGVPILGVASARGIDGLREREHETVW